MVKAARCPERRLATALQQVLHPHRGEMPTLLQKPLHAVCKAGRGVRIETEQPPNLRPEFRPAAMAAKKRRRKADEEEAENERRDDLEQDGERN